MTLTLLSVVLAACGSGGGDEAAPTTAAPTSVSTSSTTTSATTTVPFDVEVKRAAIDLMEIRNDVFQHPDVARVSDYIADTCTCLERERAIVEGFVRDGVHWNDRVVQVQGINLTVDASVDPELTLVALQPPLDLVRSDGSLTRHADAVSDTGYRVGLLRNEVGAWRINGLEGTELTADTVASILAEGLP